MAAADKVRKVCYARLNKPLVDVGADVARGLPVEREVSALSADQQFFTGNFFCREKIVQSRSYRAFASLAAIVRSGVDYVGAEFDGQGHCLGIPSVSFVIGLAQIGPNTYRGQKQPRSVPKMSMICAPCELFAKFCSALRRCVPIDRHSFPLKQPEYVGLSKVRKQEFPVSLLCIGLPNYIRVFQVVQAVRLREMNVLVLGILLCRHEERNERLSGLARFYRNVPGKIPQEYALGGRVFDARD